MHIQRTSLPASSLLQRYEDGVNYVDSYTAVVATHVTLEGFMYAFYTTRLFKLERMLLAWFARKRSTDADARELAQGRTETFAAWRVEARALDEVLLCDFVGNTRSWLCVKPNEEGTRLSFGSAVVAKARSTQGRRVLGWRFRALLGFHRLYSVALLRAAIARLHDAR